MQTLAVLSLLASLLVTEGCADLAAQAPAPRAVVFMPACLMFCFGRATETDNGRNTYTPGNP